MWQNRLDQSHEKLKVIKPHVEPWTVLPGENRRNEVKLTRVCIGHSRGTHTRFISRGRPPECEHCGFTLTIEHTLIDCQNTQVMRAQLRLPSRLLNLLGVDSPLSPLIVM